MSSRTLSLLTQSQISGRWWKRYLNGTVLQFIVINGDDSAHWAEDNEEISEMCWTHETRLELCGAAVTFYVADGSLRGPHL